MDTIQDGETVLGVLFIVGFLLMSVLFIGMLTNNDDEQDNEHIDMAFKDHSLSHFTEYDNVVVINHRDREIRHDNYPFDIELIDPDHYSRAV